MAVTTADSAEYETISKCLVLMSTGQYEDTRAAEEQLAQSSQSPSFLTCLLKAIDAAGSNPAAQAAGAIVFKNIVKKSWDISPDHGGVSEADRIAVKNSLVSMMLTYSKKVQEQLAAAIVLVAETDFPDDWPGLLEEVVKRYLSDSRADVQRTAMRTLHIVLKKYRTVDRSNDVLRQLKYILEKVQQPLLEIFKLCLTAIFERQPQLQGADLRGWIQILTLGCKIFYSLNKIDLPEFYEDHMDVYFGGFASLLQFTHKDALCDEEDELDRKGELQRLWQEICNIFHLYSDMYQEEFEQVVSPSIHAVQTLIGQLSLSPCNDGVVGEGLAFLSSASRTLWRKANPFSNHSFLCEICDKCVVPNIQLRDSDIESMEECPLEYARLDIEGGAHETRRHGALMLVKDLCLHYEDKVTDLLLRHVSGLLTPVHGLQPLQVQRHVDASSCLVTALAIRGQTRLRGVVKVSSKTDVPQFFTSYLKPCLLDGDVRSNAVYKMAALKFVATFRIQLQASDLQELIPVLQQHLPSDNVIIHTYAAYALERILSARESPLPSSIAITPTTTTTTLERTITHTLGAYKIDAAAARSILIQALGVLLKLMKDTSAQQQNEILMKCVVRIVFFLKGEGLEPIVLSTLSDLFIIIRQTSNNPRNPIYAHLLFDAAALLTRQAASSDLCPKAEEIMLETLVHILRQDLHDFAPYAFQLLGLLLDACTSPTALHHNLFQRLLEPACWTASAANVPGIIRLMGAYFRRWQLFGTLVSSSIVAILERFQYCLFHKRLMTSSFDLLQDMLDYLPLDTYLPHIQTLLKVLLTAIQQHKTEALCRCTVVSLSLLTCKAANTEQIFLPRLLDAIQPNLGSSFFKQVFIPSVKHVKTQENKKLCIIAISHFCMSPEFISDRALLDMSFSCIYGILTNTQNTVDLRKDRAAEARKRDEEVASRMDADIEGDEYSGSFNKLSTVTVASPDRLAEVTDVRVVIRQNLMHQTLQQMCSSMESYVGLSRLLNA